VAPALSLFSMKLSLEHLHLYLLDKGFLSPADLVGGDYLATQMLTRNLIFRVLRKQRPSLFIKQLNSVETSSTYVLQKDATCLWLIKNHPAFAQLSPYVPEYLGFDPERQVLVTEFLPEATNLEDYCRQHQGALPPGAAEQLAGLLATFHFPLEDDVLTSRPVQFFPQQAPWVFSLADTDPATQNLLQNPTVRPVLDAVLGNATFAQALTQVRREWCCTSLIHGDVKWMNLLQHRVGEHEQLSLIDWEFADVGDPLWDVAGVFQDLLTNVLFYTPTLAAGGSLLSGTTQHDLREAWPLLEHFWISYLARLGPTAQLADDALAKALRFTAVRLVQSAIERNMLMTTLQPNAIKLLQASYTMLTTLPELLRTCFAAPAAVYA
jgi:hypothetical protein